MKAKQQYTYQIYRSTMRLLERFADGCPHDYGELFSNSETYLSRSYIRQSVAALRERGLVELVAREIVGSLHGRPAQYRITAAGRAALGVEVKDSE